MGGWKEAVNKVRKIVRLFRRSPLKCDSLTSHTKRELGKEMKLLIDCKTRWNSLLAMLERFLEMKNSVYRALVDVGETSALLSNDEIKRIQALVSALEPVKVAAEMICRREATLITADKTFEFIIQQLEEQENQLAEDLKASLLRRIAQRRNHTLVTLLRFLDDPNTITPSISDGAFKVASKKDMITLANEQYNRLFSQRSESLNASDSTEDCACLVESSATASASTSASGSTISPAGAVGHGNAAEPHQTLAEKLQNFLVKKQTSTESSAAHHSESGQSKSFAVMKKEFNFYEGTGEKSVALTKLEKALLTIKPSSVEAERAFSTTGKFLTKFRASMADDTINTLVFLRSYLSRLKR
jgi:hypothetical protein